MGIVVEVIGDISLAYADLSENEQRELSEKMNRVFHKADYRLANMESPFCVSENVPPIRKDGPNLKHYFQNTSFFSGLNVDAYTLANNHLGDFGEQGVIDTIDLLSCMGKECVGSSKRYEDTYQPLRKVIDGIKISVLSVCENEFGTARQGKIGAAGFCRTVIKDILRKEKEWCDFFLVVFHGGTENYPYPTPEVKARYHDLVDLGADIVVGMHSHCPQGYERYKNGIIVYSTGNFFFPIKEETCFEAWRVGYVAHFTLEKDKEPGLELIPYEFDLYGHDFKALPRADFEKYMERITKPIGDDNRLRLLFEGWACFCGKARYEDFCKRLIKQWDETCDISMKNLFCCETHNELMRCYLTIRYEKKENSYLPYINKVKQDTRVFKIMYGNEEGHIDAVIWGAGERAKHIFYRLEADRKSIVFADRNDRKQGLSYCGKEILSPEEAMSRYGNAEYYICTAPQNVASIRQTLIDRGIEERQIHHE